MNEDLSYPAPQPASQSNATGLTLSIIGLVLGILALLFSFIPCIGALSLWPGLVAVALSAGGMATLKGSKGLGIAALVVSLGSVGMALYQRSQVEEIVEKGANELKKAGEQFRKDAEKFGKDLEKAVKDMNRVQP